VLENIELDLRNKVFKQWNNNDPGAIPFRPVRASHQINGKSRKLLKPWLKVIIPEPTRNQCLS